MAKKFLRAKIIHQNMPVILWGEITRIAITEGGVQRVFQQVGEWIVEVQ